MPTSNRKFSRRKALATLSIGTIGSLAGCTGILSDNEPENTGNPNPEITTVQIEADVIRETPDDGYIYVHLVNNGSLGEIELTAEVRGAAVVYASGEDIFSLEEGQEYQQRFNPSPDTEYENEGQPLYEEPDDIVVTARGTEGEENQDQWSLEKDGNDAEDILYD